MHREGVRERKRHYNRKRRRAHFISVSHLALTVCELPVLMKLPIFIRHTHTHRQTHVTYGHMDGNKTHMSVSVCLTHTDTHTARAPGALSVIEHDDREHGKT